MTIDDAGIKFITLWEGFEPNVYLDVAGKPTIGIGHLIKPSEDFSAGITLNQAEELLWRDLEAPEQAIQRLAPQANQNQTNALASFAFNLGVGSLSQMLSHGFDQAAQQILKWDKAHVNGQLVAVAGLTRRRQAESALFSLRLLQ